MNALDRNTLKARNNLFFLFLGLTILDTVLVIVSRDMWAIGRIIATIAVMYYVLQGKKWAKWVLVGIFSLVVAVLMALIIALHTKLSTFLVVGSIVMMVLIIVTGAFLICDRNLNRYFAAVRYDRSN